ncbi:MAG: DUF962 domain-containing protein [Cyclobacteriaceae bacterium]|nr:DUF962 domain-containing protein [Cyclobacteriaceae bacterium]
MSKMQALLDEYGESHQNSTNKLIHWICVPSIFFSIVGLIWSIPNNLLINLVGNTWYSNWAAVLMLLVLIYYVTLSISLSIGMAAFGWICIFLANTLGTGDFAPLWLISIIIFVIAWVGQFYGHHLEGKKPSFFKDIQFLLVGPAWLMHFIYKKIGIPY